MITVSANFREGKRENLQGMVGTGNDDSNAGGKLHLKGKNGYKKTYYRGRFFWQYNMPNKGLDEKCREEFMIREQKKNTGKRFFFLLVLVGIVICGAIFIPWVMSPENFRTEKDQIRSFLSQVFHKNQYNAKSLIVVDCSNDSIFISKREGEQQVPASLAKLFVIEYASTLADLESIVPVSEEALGLTKPNSSIAEIKPKNYFLHNLFAAMLVPSGNDAAYAVADYCGRILSPETAAGQDSVNIFMEALNRHIRELGCNNTILYDPSGFDENARTTVLDLKLIINPLLNYPWFREMISQSSYSAILPDGSVQIWKNTNAFLDPASEYYNENVIGIKTGSLAEDYNLMVLYQQYGKEFLICSLGSQSNSSRYDEVESLIQTIDESDYLANAVV